MSGSFESVRWNACLHRLDLGLYTHPKGFGGGKREGGVRTYVHCKGKNPLYCKKKKKKKKSPQRRIEPATLHDSG